jgi:hypothetical protein
MYAALSSAQLGVQTRTSLPTLMRDTTHVSRGVRWAEGSDQATVGQAMAEMMTTDLRSRLGVVRMPVLQMMAAGDARSAPDNQLSLSRNRFSGKNLHRNHSRTRQLSAG